MMYDGVDVTGRWPYPNSRAQAASWALLLFRCRETSGPKKGTKKKRMKEVKKNKTEMNKIYANIIMK